MPTTISGNGKIPYNIPSPGGDTGTWDDVQNQDTFDEIAASAYAAREDRNISILGGGKISWDSASGQVSFTEDIKIYDHITDKVVTVVQSSSSPVTLNAAGKVGYVAKNREPSANQSITAVTVVSGGALPKGVDDNGIVVLFHRTPDDTLLIPWCRREILNGDHWQFGAALSWFERIATYGKPGYRNDGSDDSQVVIPGSTTTPAVVFINGKLYANTSNKTIDLDTAGRNGLDTGAKAANTAYYLYAIPATSGRGFDAVLSVTAPTGAGPTGFTSAWSYVGAVPTEEATATIWPFQALGGTLISDEEWEDETHTGSTSSTAFTFASLPTTARQAYVNQTCNPGTAGQSARSTGVQSTTNDGIVQNGPVASQTVRNHGWIPIFTAQTIYLSVSNSAATAGAALQGFKENPMEYQ
jgi:hypothetical protein